MADLIKTEKLTIFSDRTKGGVVEYKADVNYYNDKSSTITFTDSVSKETFTFIDSKSESRPNGKSTPYEWYPVDNKTSIDQMVRKLNPGQSNDYYKNASETILKNWTTIKKTFNENRAAAFSEYSKKNPDADVSGMPGVISPSDPDTIEGSNLTGSISSNVKIPSRNFRKDFEEYKYPREMPNDQDRVIFVQWAYGSRNLELIKNPPSREYTKIGGRVILPINTPSDSSEVTWNTQPLSPIEFLGAEFASNVANKNVEAALQATGETINQFASKPENSEISAAIKAWAAGQAVSNGSVFTRLTGAIANNNIELLFSSPSLRSFSFNYDFYARGEEEAQTIINIIRFFKEGMVPQRTATNLFLKTPNVFEIKYYAAGNQKEHPAINRIKGKCALTNMSVNYAPSGSYMTYNDSNKTMTAYNVNMTFTELEPVYSSDYVGDKDKVLFDDEIGY